MDQNTLVDHLDFTSKITERKRTQKITHIPAQFMLRHRVKYNRNTTSHRPYGPYLNGNSSRRCSSNIITIQKSSKSREQKPDHILPTLSWKIDTFDSAKMILKTIITKLTKSEYSRKNHGNHRIFLNFVFIILQERLLRATNFTRICSILTIQN